MHYNKKLLFVYPGTPIDTRLTKFYGALIECVSKVDIIFSDSSNKATFFNRLFNKLKIPLDNADINGRILTYCNENNPDIVFIGKGNKIYPSTLKTLKKSGIKLISWSLDDTYLWHNRSLYYTFGLKYYDLVVTSKIHNVSELKTIGAKKILFQYQSFDPVYHVPPKSCENSEYSHDVVLVGTYEEDRLQSLLHLANNGIRVHIYGWAKKMPDDYHENLVFHDKHIYLEDYAAAMSCAKISLCFLRKKNRDTHTSRSIEIPACQGFMLAERTDEHKALFEEGKEADYFSDNNELLEKVKYYLQHPEKTKEIAKMGRQRCVESKYGYNDKIKEILDTLYSSFDVQVSVIGRFHAFDLAKTLYQHGVLHSLISTYPMLLTRRFTNFPYKIIYGMWEIEIFTRILWKLFPSKTEDTSKIYQDYFMKKSKKIVSKTYSDFFIAFAGVSLDAIKEAKKQGRITILERGSAHIVYQKNILEEEHKNYKVEFKDLESGHFLKIIERELEEYKEVDYISVPSTFAKNTFIEKGFDENKLIVNPYGVDLSNFKKVSKDDSIFRVLFVGKLSLQKGSHYLLQAFDELNLDNSEFWHIGAIGSEMKPWIDKHKNKKIKYLGSKPQTELFKYYSQGSVFVLPSIQEGLAMVQLQAMACELPLICSTNTGGDDLITEDGKEGFVIPIRDIESIKEKIMYLYENPELCKEMGKNAAKRVKNGFSWEDYGDRYYDNLLKIYKERV